MGRDLVRVESAIKDETAIGATQGAEPVLKNPVGISSESELWSQEHIGFLGGIQAITLCQPGSDFPTGF